MSKKIAFLTRPFEDSLNLAKALHEKGVASLVEPLLEVQYVKNFEPWPENVEGIICTSRHGIEGLIKSYPHIHRRIPVYTVGRSTATQAQARGFRVVKSAAGHVDALVEHLASLTPQGIWVYARGRDVTQDFSPQFREKGWEIWDPIVYLTEMVTQFTSRLQTYIRRGEVSVILCFSERTLQALTHCMDSHHLEDFKSSLVLLCASERLRIQANQQGWPRAEVVDPADQEDILTKVCKLSLA